jgi:polyphenol oxidase
MPQIPQTKPHLIKHPFRLGSGVLYATELGGVAQVLVTDNAGQESDRFAGNLALHVQDDPAAVEQRRRALSQTIGKPIQWLNQVHGTTVHTGLQLSETEPTADSCVTLSHTLALGILTADCLPLLFTATNDKGQRAIAAAHAGWRGLAAGVVEQTLATLQAQVGRAQVWAHIAPCISAPRFEVGAEVREQFLTKSSNHAAHFTPTGSGHQYLCDLEGLARDELRRLGVYQITGSGWCTASDPRLASYRANRQAGRFASLIWLN